MSSLVTHWCTVFLSTSLFADLNVSWNAAGICFIPWKHSIDHRCHAALRRCDRSLSVIASQILFSCFRAVPPKQDSHGLIYWQGKDLCWKLGSISSPCCTECQGQIQAVSHGTCQLSSAFRTGLTGCIARILNASIHGGIRLVCIRPYSCQDVSRSLWDSASPRRIRLWTFECSGKILSSSWC